MKRSRSGTKPDRPQRTQFDRRHAVTLACFLATLSAYVERVGFSIAYTAMAKVAKVDEATKGTVLSAFYWGYGVSQVNVKMYLLFISRQPCKAQITHNPTAVYSSAQLTFTFPSTCSPLTMQHPTFDALK